MAKPGEPKQSVKGARSDEVDASKGIFPADVPHPDDAETRMAGELGGGPYEESGRSSLESNVEPGKHPPAPSLETSGASSGADRPESDRRNAAPERRAARGSLPPHTESRP